MSDVIQQFKLYLIQRNIFCIITGEVLDIRTAEFLVDADGDPLIPLSPAGMAQVKSDPIRLAALNGRGLSPEVTDE